MSWYDNYIDNIYRDNETDYREFTQESISYMFDDTTLLRKVKEESYPFNEEYEEYNVHVDSIFDVSNNISKVSGDFIQLLFEDCNHINYRGQKYIYDNEYYLCYDKINKMSKIAKTKLIRCNNEISWIDDDGNILNEKVFLGYEVTSTNTLINKDGLTENRRLLLYLQCNKKTNKIQLNQRFMFQHSQCFRVEEINNYNRESDTDNDVTMMKIYLVYSALLPTDNKDLNICDYYESDYNLSIDTKDIQQLNGFEGTLTATLKNGIEDVLDEPLHWTSSNYNVVTIDDNGNYKVVGNVGDVAIIRCSMANNSSIYDEITITVVNSYTPNKEIIINPNHITELNELETIAFTCGVYIEGQKQPDIVTCVASNVDNKYYDLVETSYGYDLTNNKLYKEKPLILTFSASGCADIVLNIKLKGLF